MSVDSNILEDEVVLIEDALKGDEAAFRKIYDSLSGKMYSLCLRYASNKEDANDLFQEGCIRLFRNLGNYRFEGSFEGWARRIFVTSCLDVLKKRKLEVDELTDHINVTSDFIGPMDKMNLDELMTIVRSLPENLKIVVNLYLIEDYSHKEISEMLGITESNSKSRLHKARLLLKEKLGYTE